MSRIATRSVRYVCDGSRELSGQINGSVIAPVTDGSVMSLLPEDEQAASEIAAELRRIQLARRSGSRRAAHARLERLIDYVWFDGEPTA